MFLDQRIKVFQGYLLVEVKKKNRISADVKMLICPLCGVKDDLNYQVCEVAFIPCFAPFFLHRSRTVASCKICVDFSDL